MRLLGPRVWLGGDLYEVTAVPDNASESLPVAGTIVDVPDMGRVPVHVAEDVSHLAHSAGWLLPSERHWRIEVVYTGFPRLSNR